MLKNLIESVRQTVGAFTQKSVWLLIAPALILLAVTDAALVKTLIQWSAFAVVLAGVSIIISMITFPQVQLTALVRKAHDLGCVASAMVASALIIFFGLLFYSLVFWAKT